MSEVTIEGITPIALAYREPGDLVATMAGGLITIGHKLGLYRALAGSGPLTSAELARKTRAPECGLRIWLKDQMAAGRIIYDSREHTYALSAEQMGWWR